MPPPQPKKSLKPRKVAAEVKPAIVLTPGPREREEVNKPGSKNRKGRDPRGDENPKREAKRPRERNYRSSRGSDMTNRNRSAHWKVSQRSSHKYKSTSVPTQHWDSRPRALLLFSERLRDGDLASYLVRGGWIVVTIDLRAEHPCDVLNDQICDSMMKNIKNGEYDALEVATPCETFSPLREHPSGLRVPRNSRLDS